MNVPRSPFVALLAVLLLSACVVAPAGRGPAYVVAPALPLVVELGVEPYYYRSGFYYYYHDNRWSYARTKRGPWRDLPRDRYPREVRHQGHGYDNDGGHHHDYH